MFDIGGGELLVIGVVALIVIGPKDLPDMFRTMGRFTAKARSMAREFQRAMESAADEAGVKDVAKDLKTATSMKGSGLDAVKDAASKFEAWDPLNKKTAAIAAKSAIAAMTTSVADEAAADVADTPAPAVQAPVSQPELGPATKALAEEQAAKRAARAEAAAAKKAAAAVAAEPAAKPAPRKRTTKPKDSA